MKYILKPLAIYELGQRANQEDSIFPHYGKATKNDRTFLVCDGMGGHDSGEIASQTVCEAMSKHVLVHTPTDNFTDEQFNQALNAAYDELDAKDNGAAKKMGTTMTFLHFHDDGCLLAHIGDSRIYHIRPSEKKILFKTRDHSLVNDLIEIGELTPEEAKTFRQKNVITRAMQPNLERRPKAELKHITDIRPDDYFFMCSDGMLEETEDENLLNILSETKNSDEEKLDILIKVSENNKDNHSAYLIHVLDSISDENIPAETSKAIQEPKENKRHKRVSSIIKISVFCVLLFVLLYAASSLFIKRISKKEPDKKPQIENVKKDSHDKPRNEDRNQKQE